MRTKLILKSMSTLLICLACCLTSCGGNKEVDSIVGYWERVSGGDQEPGVCMILHFKDDNQVEKIVLYTFGGDKYVKGYEEDCGPYNLQGNKLFVFEENYDVSFSGDKMFIGDMVFKKISEKEVKKKCEGVEGLSSETSSDTSESANLKKIKELTDKFDNKMKEVEKYKDKNDDSNADAFTEGIIAASDIADEVHEIENALSESERQTYNKYMQDRINNDEGFAGRLEFYNQVTEIVKQMK